MKHNERLQRETLQSTFSKVLNSKKLLPLVLVGLLLFSIFITLSASQKKQITMSGAYPNGVELSLSSSKAQVIPGEEFLINVLIDTKALQVTASDLKIQYPANLVQVTEVRAGTFLPIILVPGNATNGLATIVLGVSPTEPKSGIGILATLVVKATATTNSNATFSFDQTTQVAAKDIYVNVIDIMSPITVAIQPPPTNTPTPTQVVATPTTVQPTPTQVANDTIPPIVTINSPLNNSRVPKNGQVNINVSATDSSGIVKIDILVDNILLKTCSQISTCQHTWNSKKAARGNHTITARATDNSTLQNTSTTSITIVK